MWRAGLLVKDPMTLPGKQSGPGGGQASRRQEGPSLSHPPPFLKKLFWPCVLVPQPGIEPAPLALGAQSLNHWTTSEVPASRSRMGSWAQCPGWGKCESKTDLHPDLDRGLEAADAPSVCILQTRRGCSHEEVY